VEEHCTVREVVIHDIDGNISQVSRVLTSQFSLEKITCWETWPFCPFSPYPGCFRLVRGSKCKKESCRVM